MSTAGSNEKSAPKIFRQSALEKLSSPEQLDLLLQVTSPRGWLALVPLCSLVIVGVVWSIIGRIPTKVAGQGILVSADNLMEVTASSGGTLLEVNVHVGDEVHEGQVVARIAQPDLLQEQELKELQAQRSILERIDELSETLELKSIEQDRAAINEMIATNEKRRATLEEISRKYRDLVARHVATEQQALLAEQTVDGVVREISEGRVRLRNLAAREAQVRQAQEKEKLQRGLRLSDLTRKISGLEERLERTSKVVCPFHGRVAELRISRRNTEVKPGSPLFLVVPGGEAEDELEATLYVAAGEGKNIRPGMSVELSPSTVRREEFGSMLGKVESIAELPTTEQAMMAHFNDPTLVKTFLQTSGIPLEIRVRLERNPATPSGYQWTSSQGPPTRVSRGTLCNATIVVEEQRPIVLLLPVLKKNGA